MAISGLDIGSENCYVAVANADGIEILLNEYSQRFSTIDAFLRRLWSEPKRARRFG